MLVFIFVFKICIFKELGKNYENDNFNKLYDVLSTLKNKKK